MEIGQHYKSGCLLSLFFIEPAYQHMNLFCAAVREETNLGELALFTTPHLKLPSTKGHG